MSMNYFSVSHELFPTRAITTSCIVALNEKGAIDSFTYKVRREAAKNNEAAPRYFFRGVTKIDPAPGKLHGSETAADDTLRLAITERCGGRWLYNPKEETPHRFMVLPDQSISNRADFIAWSGDPSIPIEWGFCCGIPHYNTDYASLRSALNLMNENEWWRVDEWLEGQGCLPAYRATVEQLALGFYVVMGL